MPTYKVFDAKLRLLREIDAPSDEVAIKLAKERMWVAAPIVERKKSRHELEAESYREAERVWRT